MISKTRFRKGFTSVPDADALEGIEGEFKVDSADGKLKATLGGSAREVLTNSQSSTLTNKTIDADSNTISNIENADIKAGAAIDASKLADGSVSNAEFQYINSLTSNAQDQIDAKASTTALNDHINDATDAHDASAISNIPSGNLSATDQQSVNNELQSDIDTRATSSALTTHTGASTGVHGVVGSVVGTSDSQSLTNKTIDADLNTISNIDNADIKTGAAIDASKIADGSVSSAEFQYLGGVTSDIQTQFGGKADGAASSTDNHVVRFDGSTGKIIQDASPVVISDAGAISGLTSVSSTGTIFAAGTLQAAGNLVEDLSTDSSTTGANATVSSPTTPFVRLTNASLTSIDTIASPSSGRVLTIVNSTGNAVTINNNTGGTAANRILTGTQGAITLSDEASIIVKYDSVESRWMIIGGTGSGAGASLDTIFQLTGTDIATWSTGDNATFLGGGTISGTFAADTSTPLSGISSYKYTQASGSLNDYMASPAQTVPLRFRGNNATCVFSYSYNGGNSDIEPIVWDATNGARLTISTNLLPAVSTPTSTYKVNVSIPITCVSIRFGFQTKIENSGKILKFDDVQLSSDVTKYSDPGLVTDWQSYTPTFTGFGTPTSVEFQWRRSGSSVDIRGKFLSGTPTTTEGRISLPNSYTSAGTTVIPSIQLVGYLHAASSQAAQYGILIEPSVGYVTFDIQSSIANGLTKQNADGITANGRAMSFFASVPVAGLTATNSQIITAAESFSTDSASLTYAGSGTYTLATLADAPVGTFITYTYASSTNTRTQTTTAPTQTTSDMNVNGVLITPRGYTSASTAALPALVAIQIGKGLKGISINGYASTAKVNPLSLDSFARDSATSYGIVIKTYNESTGILLVDAGYCSLSTYNASQFFDQSSGSQSTAYIVVNASKSPALVGVPQVLPRIATLSDVKASGTAGGSSVVGTQTRTLNTLVDTTGVVTSLTANQFTLAAGTYYIEASAPAYSTDTHKARIRNITDGTTALLGVAANAIAASAGYSESTIKGEIVITSVKVFELQHYTATVRATNGLGYDGGTGESNVFSIVKIQKIK